MRTLPEPIRWLVALLIVGLGLVGGMFLGAGLDRLAWETGITEGDSGMEIVAYLGLGMAIGLVGGVAAAAVYLRRTRSSGTRS
jgi:hypothetical protein